MNSLNGLSNYRYAHHKDESVINMIEKSDISWKIAAAALCLKGLSNLACYPSTAHLVGGGVNTIAGTMLLSKGIEEYKSSKKGNDKKIHNKSALLKIAVGSGLLCWAGYDFWKFFNPPTITSLYSMDIGQERIIAIGDVHGDLDGLQENLRRAGLINEKGDWIGGKQTFVQLGDIVDRGPKAEETWLYLRELQAQARKAGGKVIRIVGNHELMWLNQDYRYKADEDTYWVRLRMNHAIKADILNGDAQAGYVAGNGKVAFLHAGLVKNLDALLRKEVVAKAGGGAVEGVSNASIVEKINEILREAVAKDDYKHPIFQAGAARGGRGLGGVFWADKSILDSYAVSSMLQIVGHNPPANGIVPPIRLDPYQRVIYADAGMLGKYGGKRCFVELDKNEAFAQCKMGKDWVKAVL